MKKFTSAQRIMSENKFYRVDNEKKIQNGCEEPTEANDIYANAYFFRRRTSHWSHRANANRKKHPKKRAKKGAVKKCVSNCLRFIESNIKYAA